jgi:type IV pilus assembly protein PilC
MASPSELQKLYKQRQALPHPQVRTGNAGGFRFGRAVRTREIAEFTHQLATLIQARLPLARCLEILAGQQKNARFRRVLLEVLEGVKSGKSFSDSLSGFPALFGPLYVNMAAVGETGGNMPEMLSRLSLYYEKMINMRRKAATALTYPAVVVLVAIGAISFLTFGVMPTFADMFNDFDAKMPLPARILIGSGDFIRGHLLPVLILIAAGIGLFRAFARTVRGRWKIDAMRFKIPLAGSIYRKTAVARFSRTLGTLLSSGVSLLDALDTTAGSCGNLLIEKEILGMKRTAAKGEALERSVSGSNLFPELVAQMIAVGEETAELPSMLVRVAEYYEGEVDAAVEALTSVIEPVIIVVLGVILGGTIIAIYLQIFDLMNVIQ